MQDSVHENRHLFIGGSDIPVIMGISPFKKRFDLLLEKAQLKEDDFKGNVYTRYGQNMEDKIRAYINEVTQLDFVEGKHEFPAQDGEPIGIRCHTDGEVDEAILEIKTTSEVYEKLDDYGIYLVQELFYMEHSNRNYGILAVYERPEDLSEEFDPDRLQTFHFELDDYKALVDRINEEVEKFKDDLKKVKENPFITEEEIMGIPAEVTVISDQLVVLEESLANMKETEKKVKEMKATLKELMIQYGIKSWVTPNHYRITLVEDAPDTEKEEEYFDAEAMQRRAPKMYQKYLRYIKKRTVTTKGKKGYVKITSPKE